MDAACKDLKCLDLIAFLKNSPKGLNEYNNVKFIKTSSDHSSLEHGFTDYYTTIDLVFMDGEIISSDNLESYCKWVPSGLKLFNRFNLFPVYYKHFLERPPGKYTNGEPHGYQRWDILSWSEHLVGDYNGAYIVKTEKLVLHNG